ncbi:MAG: L-threonylcarbamoyladenylate synthase [bacterium]
MSDNIFIATPEAIEQAVELLKNGEMIAVPTETVYGLAADAENNQAVANIYAVKQRPQFNPLIIHVTDRQMAERYAYISTLAAKLMDAFWPGPLTLVMPRRDTASLSPLVTAGLTSIAIRCPAAPVAQAVLRQFDRAFAAPSANPSGQLSPTHAAHVAAGLGAAVPMILDAGPSQSGLESTIIDVTGERPVLLRPGTLTIDQVEEVAGITSVSAGNKIIAPGMMSRHYAPSAKLRLNALTPRAREGFLGFGPIETTAPDNFNLSPSGDLVEAAVNLFSYLHRLDTQYDFIAVAPIPQQGIGIAINDRLKRAATLIDK